MSVIKKLISILLVFSLMVPVCSFAVTQSGGGTPDGTPPVLHDICIGASQVNAPEKLTLTAYVSDDVSGVGYATGTFENPRNKRSISVDFDINNEPITDGEIIATVNVSMYEPSGEFKLQYVTIKDLSGNYSHYYSKDYSIQGRLVLPNEISFTVINGSVEPDVPDVPDPPDPPRPPYPPYFDTDKTPPVLRSASVDKTEATAPTVLSYTLEVTDDISGVDGVYVHVKNLDGTFSNGFHAGMDRNGMFKGKFQIPRGFSSSMYYVSSIEIFDLAGNISTYQSNREIPIENAILLPNEIETKVTRPPEDVYDFEVNLSEPTLVQQIKDAPDGAKVHINCTGASLIVPGKILNAIYGSNKTLTFLRSPVFNWSVNGNNVFSEHSSDFSLGCDSPSYLSGQDLFGIPIPSNNLIFSFDEAGKFPAKFDVTVRDLGLDWDNLPVLNKTGLYIYHVDENAKKFIEVATDVSLTSDEKLPITVTYGGKYLVVEGKLDLSGNSDAPDESSSSDQSSDNDQTISPKYWDDVSNKIKSQSAIKIQMSSDDIIPYYIFKEIYGKDITITISCKGKDDIVVNGKTMYPIEPNRICYSVDTLWELYKDSPGKPINMNLGQTTKTYGTLSIDRGAHDLVMLHMGKLNLSEDEYATYYLKNYETLYKKFHTQLSNLSK